MQITIAIKRKEGSEIVVPTVVEVDVPDFEAFDSPDKFGEIFDQYEREVLKARNAAMEVATEHYLDELAKKKHHQRGRHMEEKSMKSQSIMSSTLKSVVYV